MWILIVLLCYNVFDIFFNKVVVMKCDYVQKVFSTDSG